MCYLSQTASLFRLLPLFLNHHAGLDGGKNGVHSCLQGTTSVPLKSAVSCFSVCCSAPYCSECPPLENQDSQHNMKPKREVCGEKGVIHCLDKILIQCLFFPTSNRGEISQTNYFKVK